MCGVRGQFKEIPHSCLFPPATHRLRGDSVAVCDTHRTYTDFCYYDSWLAVFTEPVRQDDLPYYWLQPYF